MNPPKVTRIYAVYQQGKSDRLVRAHSQAAAYKWAADPQFTVEIPTSEELVELTLKGVKIEDAKAE